MSYTKTNWVDEKTKLNAQNMNHIEDGIKDNDNRITNVENDLIAIEGLIPPEVLEPDNELADKIFVNEVVDTNINNVRLEIDEKQDKLVAGEGIQINNNVISTTDYKDLALTMSQVEVGKIKNLSNEQVRIIRDSQRIRMYVVTYPDSHWYLSRESEGDGYIIFTSGDSLQNIQDANKEVTVKKYIYIEVENILQINMNSIKTSDFEN